MSSIRPSMSNGSPDTPGRECAAWNPKTSTNNPNACWSPPPSLPRIGRPRWIAADYRAAEKAGLAKAGSAGASDLTEAAITGDRWWSSGEGSSPSGASSRAIPGEPALSSGLDEELALGAGDNMSADDDFAGDVDL